jgi:hypothetical protein
LRGLSQWVQLYIGAQINFGDLTSYLTYVQNHTIIHARIGGLIYSGQESAFGACLFIVFAV